MSFSKYASNAVEKCLVYGNEEQRHSIVGEILALEDSEILKLMRDI